MPTAHGANVCATYGFAAPEFAVPKNRDKKRRPVSTPDLLGLKAPSRKERRLCNGEYTR